MTKFIVQEAAAAMPASCWGRYVRVAVLEVDADLDRVAMISERARGCHRVVETWERCHDGRTARCAAAQAREAAREIAGRLNAQTEVAAAA